jgi:hypothetical protein
MRQPRRLVWVGPSDDHWSVRQASTAYDTPGPVLAGLEHDFVARLYLSQLLAEIPLRPDLERRGPDWTGDDRQH